MSTEPQRLQRFWDGLRANARQRGGYIDDDTCLQTSRTILTECFKETKHKYPALMQWWFERSVIQIRNAFFGNVAVATLTDDAVIGCGRAVKRALCADSEDPRLVVLHALEHLGAQPDTLSRQALESIADIAPDAFVKLWGKKQNILLQAAAVILSYIADSERIHACLIASVDDFRGLYANVIADDGTTMVGSHVEVTEEVNLLFTCNLMRIAKLFVAPQRGKGRYIDMTTQLAEGRTYCRGGGHAVYTERREKLFETETGVPPIPRPKLTPANADEILTTERIAEIIARNALCESPRVSIVVKRAEKEIPLGKKRTDSLTAHAGDKFMAIAQEIYFDGVLVTQSLENTLKQSSGKMVPVSVDVVMPNIDEDGDLIELEGVPLTGNDFGAVEAFDPEAVNPMCAQNSNSSNRSTFTTSSNSRMYSMRSSCMELLFTDLESVLPDAKFRQYQILNYGLSSTGINVLSSETIDYVSGSKRVPPALVEDDDGDGHLHKRRNAGTSCYEILQQTDADGVDMIPSEELQQLFMNARSQDVYFARQFASMHQTSAVGDGDLFPPAPTAEVHNPFISAYFDQSFNFPIVYPEAVSQTLFGEADQSDLEDQMEEFLPDQVFEMMQSPSNESQHSKMDSSNQKLFAH